MRDDAQRIEKIRETLDKLTNYFDLLKYQHDYFYRYGVVKALENIGEEVRCLNDATKAKVKNFNWKAIIAMRNILVHEYDQIDWDIVLNVVETKVFELNKVIDELDD